MPDAVDTFDAVDAFDTLVACGRSVVARAAGSPESPSHRSGPVDWNAVLDLAASHGMQALVCREVLDRSGDPIGADAVARLTAAQRALAARGLAAVRQLGEIMRVLGGAGVPALPYKGPALAHDAYGAATLRESDDLDIVVAPTDLTRARDVLMATGYHPADGLPWRDSLEVNEWQGHVALARADASLPVELHWRFCDRKLPWSLPVADVLRRATHQSLAGVTMPIPERSDQLLLVLLHAARHAWDRLEGIACAGALIAAGNPGSRGGTADAAGAAVAPGPARTLNVDTFVTRGREIGGLRAALVGLEVTRRLLGTPLPDALTGAAQDDPRVAVLADIAIARLRAGTAGDERDARLHLASLERTPDQLRYVALAALLPTPRDRQVVNLPWSLAPLHVPLRLARLARLAGRALTR